MSEQYGRLKDDAGWAYAVLVDGQGVQRFHDTRDLARIREDLDGVRRAALLDDLDMVAFGFSGAGDGDPDAESTGAGEVLVSKVVGVRYWSPRDDAARDGAYETAAVLVGTVDQVLVTLREGIDEMRGVGGDDDGAPEPEPADPEGAGSSRPAAKGTRPVLKL